MSFELILPFLRPIEPLLVDEKQRVSEVVELMAQHGRRLAVVMHDDETPIGVVTPREIADHMLASGGADA